MAPRWLLPELKSKEQALAGIFVQTPHVGLGEFLAAQPLDLLCIEGEHSPFSGEVIRTFAMACDLHGMPLMVRVPEVTSFHCAMALDAGACGILAPRVNTRDQAEALVAACRYPPLGTRGSGPGRASGYGGEVVDYIRQANDNVLVALQIETAEAVENLEEILSVDGLDLVFIGPMDLAVSLTGRADVNAPEAQEATKKVLQRSKAAGLMTGIFAASPEVAAGYANMGVDLILLGSDLSMLGRGIASAFADYRAQQKNQGRQGGS